MEGSQLGDYQIVRLIGRGGMGAVYEAHNPTIKRRVAIKQLLPEFTKRDDVVRRFHNEAVAVNAINHPGVVQVSEVGKAPDGSLYLVMEFLEGETLSARRSRGPLPVVMVVHLAWQLAHSLATAHARGVIHRDLKPANVLVETTGRAVITDFGVACSTDGDPEDRPAQRPERRPMTGTPAYMAPEQVRGLEANDRSDQFAFCVALYEALYGERPFAGGTPAELAYHVMRGERRPLPPNMGVPAWLQHIATRGLALVGAARWPSMAAMADALEQGLAENDPRADASSG